MGKHRIGDVGLQRLVNQIQKRMERPVSVPERESGHVRESLSLLNVLIQPAEASVGILEQERVQGGAIDAGVEGLSQSFVICVQIVSSQLFLPFVLRFLQHCLEIFAIQLLQIQQSPLRADSGDSDLDLNLLSFRCREANVCS